MKKLYHFLIVFVCLVFTTNVRAQENNAQVFTLDQCIEFALKNSISVQNSAADEEIADEKVKETVGIGMPQVNGFVTVDRNEKLRRFFTTYDPNGGFIDLSGVPGIEEGDVVAAQNFFQLKSSGDAGVNINQIIFNGSYLVGLQASKAYKNLAYKNSAYTKEQTVQAVTTAYYAVLINRERSKLFDSNIARVDSLLRDTKALNASGFAESIDVDRVQVVLNNLITERNKFLTFNELGISLLKFQMNYPMTDPIEISGNIQDVQIEASLESYQENWDYKSRPDYQVLEANKILQELNIKNYRAQSLPSLSAFANLGYSTQSSDFAGIFKTNSDIKDSGGVGPDKWYGYSMFGFSLSVPIFSGFQLKHRIQQEKLGLKKINNGFVTLKSSIDLQIKQSTLNFQDAIGALTAQKQNMELAANIARVTKVKYEQGVGTNLEVIQAETDLRTAQTNYYGALFDAMIAKVDLDKAYGKLKVTEPK